jgi:anti-anti-sigma factor
MLHVQAKNLGTVAVLSLQGQIVNGETEILREAVQAQAALSGVNALQLDLARVTTVDAGGLGTMLQLREQAEAKGIRFELMNVTKQIGRVLALSRLDSVFRITAGGEFYPAAARSHRTRVTSLASCA